MAKEINLWIWSGGLCHSAGAGMVRPFYSIEISVAATAFRYRLDPPSSDAKVVVMFVVTSKRRSIFSVSPFARSKSCDTSQPNTVTCSSIINEILAHFETYT